MTPFRRNALPLAMATVLVAALVPGAATRTPAAASTVPIASGHLGKRATADFNGDGYSDLAIGTHRDNIGGKGAVGSVTVLYGGRNGLGADGSQVWWEGSAGIVGDPAVADSCGGALAPADFNGDGYSDLAFSCPGTGLRRYGAVRVLYGGPNGLTADGNSRWAATDFGEHLRAHDEFGSGIVAGDFNGDHLADLAITGERSGRRLPSTVQVMYGRATGLSARGSTTLKASPKRKRIRSTHLAAGDANGDGFDELAWAFPLDLHKSGAVAFYSGSAKGIDKSSWFRISQSSPGVPGKRGAGEEFGGCLVFADVNGDGYDDVVVGAFDGAGEGWPSDETTITALFGGVDGITAVGSQRARLQQWVGSRAELQPALGALSAGDSDGDGFADIAVTADVRFPVPDAYVGALVVVHGTAAGLDDVGRVWTEDTPGVPDEEEKYDFFGFNQIWGDYDSDGYEDIAIGSHDSVADLAGAGAVFVLRGGQGGLTTEGVQEWAQGQGGIGGDPESGELFGSLNGMFGVTN